MRIGIRERIVGITTVILLLAIGLNTLIVGRQFRASYFDSLRSEMYVICLSLKSQMERILQLGISVRDVEGFDGQCRELISQHPSVTYAMIVQSDGKVLYHSGWAVSAAPVGDPMLLEALKAKQATVCQSEYGGASYYHMVVPIDEGNVEGPGAAAVISVPTTLVDGKTRHLVSVGLAAGLVLSLAAVVLLVASLSASVTKPLSRLTLTISEVAAGSDLSKRVEVASSDELGVLAASFNRMVSHLQQTTTSIDNLNREMAVRREAQARQAVLIEQVNAANKELTEFAYVASHDLKAPLRGVKALADWIHQDCYEKLDAENRQRLDLLTSRVDRMHQLIEGILQYSRIGRADEQVGPVDLDKLVDGIVDMIQPPEHIRIVVENTLPTVQADETRIGQVFQNLLSNAVKYMNKPKGLIRVGCVADGDFWRFSVSDNGPGIEEQYFEKIFGVFQTLNRKDEYESTGLGLAIVKKIVERYGGRVWVESQIGQGSTFLFTLPKRVMETSNERPESTVAC
jgi:signal transduction histidine kinase